MNPDLDQRVAHLEKQMRHFSDLSEIEACLKRYTRGVDRLDADLIASAFHDDALSFYGQGFAFTDGAKSLAPAVIALLKDYWRSGCHHLEIKTVEIEKDTAYVESYLWDSLLRQGEEIVDVSSTRYVDQLERREGAWKIAIRHVLVEITGALPAAAPMKGMHVGSQDRNDISYRRPVPTSV